VRERSGFLRVWAGRAREAATVLVAARVGAAPGVAAPGVADRRRVHGAAAIGRVCVGRRHGAVSVVCEVQGWGSIAFGPAGGAGV
jgi:hypothetical protein